MTQILYAKPVVAKKIGLLKKQVQELKNAGLTPHLKVILVGNDPASLLYVSNKRKMCERIGAKFELLHLSQSTTEKDFLKEITAINQNPNITGAFVQLPIGSNLINIDTTNLICPHKDVDGFHQNNIAKLYANKVFKNTLIPCTPKGIISLLEHYNLSVAGKSVCVIGRSLIVGKPLSMLMLNHNATVSMCHSQTPDLTKYTLHADIIVLATGKANLLTAKHIRHDQTQTIIDVGINKINDQQICGDANFNELQGLVKAISPVPGGIGPMTIISLMENLIIATQNQLQEITNE
jgi:methylenetetrahydrofolate dehydrogenase (NADP+)/methenyltetrahydrofolate cyclohydrolase